MNHIIKKIILFSVFLFFIPAIAYASQIFPPEMPVLFYGQAEINNDPVAINTVISVKIEENNFEIASSTIKDVGRYFIEVPCEKYIGENIFFKVNDLIGGQSQCVDISTTPSIKLDLTISVLYNQTAVSVSNPPPSGGGLPIWLLKSTVTGFVPEEEKKKEVVLLGVEHYEDGTLIRGKDKKIYVIQNRKRQHIKTLKELIKYSGEPIFDVDDETLSAYSGVEVSGEGYGNGALIRGNDKKIYVIENGKKKHIINMTELKKYAGKKINNVTEEVIAQY